MAASATSAAATAPPGPALEDVRAAAKQLQQALCTSLRDGDDGGDDGGDNGGGDDGGDDDGAESAKGGKDDSPSRSPLFLRLARRVKASAKELLGLQFVVLHTLGYRGPEALQKGGMCRPLRVFAGMTPAEALQFSNDKRWTGIIERSTDEFSLDATELLMSETVAMALIGVPPSPSDLLKLDGSVLCDLFTATGSTSKPRRGSGPGPGAGAGAGAAADGVNGDGSDTSDWTPAMEAAQLAILAAEMKAAGLGSASNSDSGGDSDGDGVDGSVDGDAAADAPYAHDQSSLTPLDVRVLLDMGTEALKSDQFPPFVDDLELLECAFEVPTPVPPVKPTRSSPVSSSRCFGMSPCPLSPSPFLSPGGGHAHPPLQFNHGIRERRHAVSQQRRPQPRSCVA